MKTAKKKSAASKAFFTKEEQLLLLKNENAILTTQNAELLNAILRIEATFRKIGFVSAVELHDNCVVIAEKALQKMRAIKKEAQP
jgi:hypothetical protein